MKDKDLAGILCHLLNLPGETETVEFKEAKNSFDFGKLGKYFSALSNEANLKGYPSAWLIFGIEDKKHAITGTNFRRSRKDLDSLKGEVANKTTNRITFIEIHELKLPEGRVVMFQIPAGNKDLSLDEIMLLDKVQKNKGLNESEENFLRDRKLIEGHKPNYFISKSIAQITGQKAAYSKNKGFEKSYYLDFILKAIKEHAFMERKDIDDLLWSKPPDLMNEKQKKNKINNLLSELRKNQKIKNEGVDSKPRWVLLKYKIDFIRTLIIKLIRCNS